MAVRITGSANLVESTSNNRLKVDLETNSLPEAEGGFASQVGCVRMFSEVDNGSATGEVYLLSPEVDDDYRMRVSYDNLYDTETFNYTAQNTGKHTYANTTLTASWSTAGLQTNSGNVTTTTTGLTVGTYAEFPMFGNSSMFCEMEGSFSANPVTGSVIDFGMFRRGASTAYAPTDGVYFRHTSAGLQGVSNYNGVETVTGAFAFNYVINHKYQFIITITQREIKFWIDGVLYGEIEAQIGTGQPFISATLPLSIRHALTATASGIINFNLNNYCVSVSGSGLMRSPGEANNAMLGAYQGLSGGTMGQLVSGTVTTGTLVKPTAAVPSNTALTANLGNSLGGRSWETYTTPLGTNTDGIVTLYQNPAGTVAVQGKRLKITGVKMVGTIQTAITGGPFVQEWMLIFGGTAASLQTTEAAAAKVCRRIMLPEFTQVITAAQAASTLISQPSPVALFDQPIYVNPGEYVGLANNWFGTAPTAGVAAYVYQFVYSWE